MYMFLFVAMINYFTIFFVFVIIMPIAETGNFIPFSTLSVADVFVNAEKGFVLQHVGTYSPQLEKGILHTFMPILDSYKSSLNIDVNRNPSKLIDQNILQLGNILSPMKKIFASSKNNKKYISDLIVKDIYDTLAVHQPGELINNITTSFHIFDNHFYLSNTSTPNIELTSNNSVITSQQKSSVHLKNPVAIIIDQRIQNKIGFDFLPDDEISNFITPIMSSIDRSYINFSQETLVADFFRLIISQSIHLLRSCSINSDDIEKSPPCLIISTLFQRLPTVNSFTYSVFQLTPIPISIDGFKYVYTNLPKTFGINMIEQNLLIWNDEHERSNCEFNRIVQCSQQPIPIPLSNIPCLKELLSTDDSYSTDCPVSKLLDFSPGFFEIAQEIWVFYNLQKNHHCKVFSTSKDLTNIVTVEEPSVLRLPCRNAVKCFNLELPPPACTNKKIMIKSNLSETYDSVLQFQLPLKNLIRRLEFSYKGTAQNLIKQVLNEIDDADPPMQKILKKFTNLINDAVLLFVLAIIIIIGRIVQVKLYGRVDKVERGANKMADIFSLDSNNSYTV